MNDKSGTDADLLRVMSDKYMSVLREEERRAQINNSDQRTRRAIN
jgi:hypothetical protein